MTAARGHPDHRGERRAVFLDRDGTIIVHVHHLRDPADVRLVPGAGEAVRALQVGGYAVIVVTNQSVVGRGLLSEAGLARVHAEMCRQLATFGVELDGYYYCAAVPTDPDPLKSNHPDRKPQPGMLFRAERELGLDLPESWMIGDTLSDALAGRNGGCKATIVVRSGHRDVEPDGHSAIDHVVDDLAAAVDLILGNGQVAHG
jgi:D-glycero-D-manno-heptose 1,7-bisphosphate phosphatase